MPSTKSFRPCFVAVRLQPSIRRPCAPLEPQITAGRTNPPTFYSLGCECYRKIPETDLIVQTHTQKRSINLQPAVILNKSQFPELIHKKIHPRTRSPHHLREHLLWYLRQHQLRC